MRKEERFRLGEFWLDRRSDSASACWQITWYDKGRRQTRQRSTGTTDFELARHRLAEHYIGKGERRDESPDTVLIEHVLTRYYEQHAKKLPSGQFASYALDYWKRYWGAHTVADMTLDRLEAFPDWLARGKARAMGPATVNRVLAVGRAALVRAKKRQEITVIPFVPSVTVPRPKLYRASLPEIAKLLNATDTLGHVRRWMVGSIVTLARPEPVLQLSRPQLDFELRRIDLNPPGRPQNAKHRPIVPMTETAYHWLSGDWTGLWITYEGRPLASIRMGFERARKRASLSSKITRYTLRRTLAAELRRRGVPPWELAGFMGHSVREYSVTEDYAEYAPDYLGHAARVIDEYCRELQPLLDFELVRTNCVPPQKASSTQVAEKTGWREWDRTTDHHHVNVSLLQRKQTLK
jgi:hypothetical protein